MVEVFNSLGLALNDGPSQEAIVAIVKKEDLLKGEQLFLTPNHTFAW